MNSFTTDYLNFTKKATDVWKNTKVHNFEITKINNYELSTNIVYFNLFKSSGFNYSANRIPSHLSEWFLEELFKEFDDLEIVGGQDEFSFENPYKFGIDTYLLTSRKNKLLVRINPAQKSLNSKSNSYDYSTFSIVYDKPSLGIFYKLKEKVIEDYESSDRSNSINIIKEVNGEFDMDEYQFKKFDLNLKVNYNDEIIKFDEDVMSWINSFDLINNRLVLMSGEPGTGKTNYIKNVISRCPEETNVIYVSPSQTLTLLNPSFMNFIRDYKDSVLIIEDAEEILLKRSDSNTYNSFVNLMLNLTDGILASVLNFKVICTFNVSEDQIDPALLRKGRLFRKFKFEKLSEDKTKSLYKSLYNEDPPSPRMSLATIYEREENGVVEEEKRSVGFC